MAIRLLPHVLDDGAVDVVAWQDSVRAGISVGRCDCGGRAGGEPILIGRRLTWATAVCVDCGTDAPRPVVVAKPSPLSAEREPAGARVTPPRRPAQRSAESVGRGQRRARRALARRP